MRKIANGSFYSKIEQVAEKEELVKLLEQYKGILSTPMIEYLNSLIELEFSIVRPNIGEQDRHALAQLDIYRDVAIYNIYNRASKLLREINENLIISGNENGLEKLSAKLPLENGTVELYEFDYSTILSLTPREKMPKEYRSSRIGTIHLYQTVESKEKSEKELASVLQKLNKLYDEKNPYPYQRGIAGGPRPMWEMEHRQAIRDYENKWKILEERQNLSDDDKRSIEWTNRVYECMLQDYGLTQNDFEEESIKGIPSYYALRHSNNLEKTLTKTQPGLLITKEIKYL